MSQFSISGFTTGELRTFIEKWNADPDKKHQEWADVVKDLGLFQHSITYSLVKLAWANHRVWHHEDPCRSGVPVCIMHHKPQIDIHNQIRNDLIEKIDEWAVGTLQGAVCTSPPSAAPVYNTETIGSIVDRLTILALKLYHTTKLSEAGVEKALLRLPRLHQQWNWLAREFSMLVLDVQRGRRLIRTFSQFKTYNDPELNLLHKDRDRCPDCRAPVNTPALEHNRGCSLRVQFFGGKSEWDTDSDQELDGVKYQWDADMGTWKPKD